MEDYILYIPVLGMLIALLEVIFNCFIVYFIVKLIFSGVKRRNNKNYFKSNVVLNNDINRKKKYIDINKEQLNEFNTDDLDGFKESFYKLFVDFENAYNNLDYNLMRTLSTKQLFQNYYTGITLDLEKGNKKIINNIEKRNVIIYETFTSTAKQVVSSMIEISYNNYTINKNGNIIKGNRLNKINEKFEVTFRKDFEQKEIVKCPNCGATVISNKCDFCRTKVKNVDFRISNIKKIIE